MLSRLSCALSLTLAFATLVGPSVAEAQTKLLRFPDISGDRVVFCHAGDLWTASATGGTATRLTSHPGEELFPKFSPDGQWIAFTGQYDGDEQVYVVRATGGVPEQLTYYPARGPLAPRHGYDHQVYGWTPSGDAVVFRSFRDAGGAAETNLFTVSTEGGLPTRLPMPSSGAGDFSPDGLRLVYSPLFRDFRSWKRYSGGWAQDLYLFDLTSHEAEKIADSDRSERDPMWIGDKIYFASDRDDTLNLYSYDIASRAVRQHTHSTTWDVRWPSSDNVGRIVYELDGELEVYDIASGEASRIAIDVPNDGVAMRPSRIGVSDYIEAFSLSPKGERVLFVARGDVFTAPIEHGVTRNLTRSSGVHDKWARWSPDGSQIAFISDATGEEEIYLIAQDGSGEPEQLTEDGRVMRYAPRWSPDGKRLAFSDKNGKVYVLEIESRQITEIADDANDQVNDYTWSPRGGHLAFSLTEHSGFRAVYVWSVADGQLRQVTDVLFDSFRPAWDRDGDYLYFLSRPAIRAPDLERGVELRRQPRRRHLRLGVAGERAQVFFDLRNGAVDVVHQRHVEQCDHRVHPIQPAQRVGELRDRVQGTAGEQVLVGCEGHEQELAGGVAAIDGAELLQVTIGFQHQRIRRGVELEVLCLPGEEHAGRGQHQQHQCGVIEHDARIESGNASQHRVRVGGVLSEPGLCS